MPVNRFCAFVWWYVTKEAGEKDRERFRSKLWIPPRKYAAEIPEHSPWSAESENKAFAAFRAETGL